MELQGTLWKKIQQKQTALAFLSETVLAHQQMIQVIPAEGDQPLNFEPFLEVNEEAIDTWNHHWQLQTKLTRFMDELPPCFPIAAQLSHSHGKHPQQQLDWLRGGMDGPQSSSSGGVPRNRIAWLSLVSQNFLPISGCGFLKTLCLGSESLTFRSEVTRFLKLGGPRGEGFLPCFSAFEACSFLVRAVALLQSSVLGPLHFASA